MSKTIGKEDAHLILTNSAKFPTKGAQCNGSCVFYFACQNSKDFSECTGFLMLNGESERLLKRGLTEHDLEYIENAHSVIQRSLENGHPEDARVILRDISQLGERVTPQPTERKSGIAHMIECALGIPNTPTQEPERQTPETRSTEGLGGMLDAISRTQQTHSVTLTRAIDESLFPTLCDGQSCPKEYQKHCSANRIENIGKKCIYKTLTNEELKHPETQQRIARSATLPEMLDRLETLETEVWKAENSAKNNHIIPNRPNFCKPKSVDGVEE